MKIFIILLYIIKIQIYESQLCEEIKTCYNCTISDKNCIWVKDELCYSSNQPQNLNNKNNNKEFLNKPYITGQYQCIQNENDIEILQGINNSNIILRTNPDLNNNSHLMDNINYHIYCFDYIVISNISIEFNSNTSHKENIIHLSLYDRQTNSEKIINMNNNTKITLRSNFICVKITYVIGHSLEDILSFRIYGTNNNDILLSKNSIKNDNFKSYLVFGCIILFIILVIWIFFICHRCKNNIMKELIIINKDRVSLEEEVNNKTEDTKRSNNCDKSNCSELQEKYFQLERKSFVEHNYETLSYFVQNIPDKVKRDIYLKTIIKTLPSFLIEGNNSDLIGSFCSFCENKIKLNDNVCLLNCGHIFHYDCIYQQIITNEEYSCIICKENIII